MRPGPLVRHAGAMSTSDVISPYGPASVSAAPRRPMLVVPFHPARGWAAADVPRRVAAVAAVPLALLYVALGDRSFGAAPALILALAGPPTFYSLARVLRPYAPGGERTLRHWAAATSTAYSLPGLLIMSDLSGDSLGAGILLALVAVLGGALTLAWGLIALVVRLSRR